MNTLTNDLREVVAENVVVTNDTLKLELADGRAVEAPPAASFREEEVVEELRGRIREAARSRLVSDVPLGVFLSGGVDSSTLAALMSELTPQGGAVNSFSVSFREKSFNESSRGTISLRRERWPRPHKVSGGKFST